MGPTDYLPKEEFDVQDKHDTIISQILMVAFALGVVLGIYQFMQVLQAPIAPDGLFNNDPKIDLLSIIAEFIVLNVACLITLFFPAGKYWKYVSVAIGVLGMILCYWMGVDFYTEEQYSDTHSGVLWMAVYPLLLWILWGMFIPYLEKQSRRLWLWGYPAACLLIYLIHLIPPPNT